MSFSTYAHAIHVALRRRYPHLPLKLGQVQQLLAASLGHHSLASYQHAQPPEQLGQHILVDHHLLIDRCAELGLPETVTPDFLMYFQSVAKQTIHMRHSDYVLALTKFVAAAMPMLPSVQTHLSHREIEVGFSEGGGISVQEPLELHSPLLHVVNVTVELSDARGRLHPQPDLFFDGCVVVAVLGRRCLGAFELTGDLKDESKPGAEALEYAYISGEC